MARTNSLFIIAHGTSAGFLPGDRNPALVVQGRGAAAVLHRRSPSRSDEESHWFPPRRSLARAKGETPALRDDDTGVNENSQDEN
jgi:hypothetical protein